MSVASASIAMPKPAISAQRANPLAGPLFMALLCMVLFLLVNPFLALFIMALASFRWPVPKYVFIASASFGFALMFFSREYGVEWYPGFSGDDIPVYLALYEYNYGFTFAELVERFLSAPNGNEILWHTPWWVLINQFDASTETFIFLHYLAVFASVFVTMRLLSRKYWIIFTVVYFFLTPIAVDGVAHVWRQQMAFSMFVSGIGLVYGRGVRAGGWLIHLSPLMHVSLVFFLIAYWTFLLIRRIGGFERPVRFVLLIVLLMASVPILSSMAVRFLDALGMARILSFFEGYGTNVVRVYLILLVYAVPMLVLYFWLRVDDMNRLFLVLCFAVFSIVLALPGANGIYDRLLMFALPLMGIYFYRCLLMNFPERWHAPVLGVIFALGAYRHYLPTREGAGVFSFVAHGHGLDPTMGIARLLSGL